jgi:hypothetical protein
MLLGGGNHVCRTLHLDREVPKEMKEQNKIREETLVHLLS